MVSCCVLGQSNKKIQWVFIIYGKTSHENTWASWLGITLEYISDQSKLILGLHRTPEGLETDLQPKNGQTRDNSGVGWQGLLFLLCYSSEGQKLLLDTHNDSVLLAIEIDKVHNCF